MQAEFGRSRSNGVGVGISTMQDTHWPVARPTVDTQRTGVDRTVCCLSTVCPRIISRKPYNIHPSSLSLREPKEFVTVIVCVAAALRQPTVSTVLVVAWHWRSSSN